MTSAIQEFNDHVIDTVSEETQWAQYIRMLKSGNRSKIAVRDYQLWEEKFLARDNLPKQTRRDALNAYFRENYDTLRWKGETCMSQFSHLASYFAKQLNFNIADYCCILYAQICRWQSPDDVEHATIFTQDNSSFYTH